MRIELRGDLQQRREEVIAGFAVMVPEAEILHRASPVDVRQQPVITETHPFQHLGRADVQDFFERGPGPYFVRMMQGHSAGAEESNHAGCGNDGSLAAVHFRFRFSKISTAPLRAMAA